MHFLWHVTFIFFCLGFVSRTLTNNRTAGKGRGYFLAPLYHFHPRRKSFGLQRLQLSERFNDERGRRRRIQEPYYILLYENFYKSKLGGIVSGSAFDISFQPLIIAVKHSVKLDVIELLDSPLVFTC